jgi:subtilisin family serine protease
MNKNKLMAGFFVSLFLLSYLVKPGFGETNNYDSLAIQKIDSSLLSSTGETSAIIQFSKKPSNYKQIIRSLGGSIVQDYSNMDSVAVKIDGKNVSKLASLGNLIRVYEDKKVKALLHDSAPLISADQVWNMGITGKDVKVCVVDTGVDYKHTALGSCNHLILTQFLIIIHGR